MLCRPKTKKDACSATRWGERTGDHFAEKLRALLATSAHQTKYFVASHKNDSRKTLP